MSPLDRGAQFFPSWFSRWQSMYLNPPVRRLAPYLPSFAVIEHRGRKSGKVYQTPVNVFYLDGKLGIVLGHGITDWVRNVLAAGEADVRHGRAALRIINPLIGDSTVGLKLPLVPRVEIALARATTGRRLQLFVAEISSN